MTQPKNLSPASVARAKRFMAYYNKVLAERDPKLAEGARQMWHTFKSQADELAIWDVCPSKQAVYFYYGVTKTMCTKGSSPPIQHVTAGDLPPPDDLDPEKVTLLTAGMMLGMYLEELGMAHFLTRSNEPYPPGYDDGQ